jgi:ribose/xylose/arabinose/galactoside ABC-type transport system permease subunit
MQPIIATLILMVAGRGIAQLITGGQIVTIYYPPYFFIGAGYLARPAVRALAGGRLLALMRWLLHRTALGLFIQASGGTRRRPVWRASAHAPAHLGVRLLRPDRRYCRADDQLQREERRRQQRRQLLELDAILAVTLGGTSLLGGRFSLAAR